MLSCLRSFLLTLLVKDVIFQAVLSPSWLLSLTVELSAFSHSLTSGLGQYGNWHADLLDNMGPLFCLLLLSVLAQLACTQNFLSLHLFCTLFALVSPYDHCKD